MDQASPRSTAFVNPNSSLRIRVCLRIRLVHSKANAQIGLGSEAATIKTAALGVDCHLYLTRNCSGETPKNLTLVQGALQ